MRHCLTFLPCASILSFGAASRKSKRAARHGAAWVDWRPRREAVREAAAPAPPVAAKGPPPARRPPPSPEAASRAKAPSSNGRRRPGGSFRALVAGRRDAVSKALRAAVRDDHARRAALERRRASQDDVAERLSLDLQTLQARRRELQQYLDAPLAEAKRRRALLGQRGAFELLGPRALAIPTRRPPNVYFDCVCRKEIEHLQRAVAKGVAQHAELTKSVAALEAAVSALPGRLALLNAGASCLERLLGRITRRRGF